MIGGKVHLSYEDRLRELGLLSLENRMLWGKPYSSFPVPKEAYGKAGEGLSESVVIVWWFLPCPSGNINPSAQLRACISAVEKLFQQVHHLKEHISSSSLRQSSISAIKSQHFPAQGKEYPGHTPHGTPWFYLHDHKEDMRK